MNVTDAFFHPRPSAAAAAAVLSRQFVISLLGPPAFYKRRDMSSSSWTSSSQQQQQGGGGVVVGRVVRFAAAAAAAIPMVLPEEGVVESRQQPQKQQQQQQRRRRVRWIERVQGRRELTAACTAAKREDATMLVRLSRTDCRPCAASAPLVQAALEALGVGMYDDEGVDDENEADDADRTAGPQLRVYWLNADDPGSSDAMAFFTSRRLCRGVPAHFLWRGSQDLHMPDLALNGTQPVALARLLARAAAASGPADLGEPGAMDAKNADADLARLRREGDRDVLAVLAAIESRTTPTPIAMSVPMVPAVLPSPPVQQQQQQQQPPFHYYPPPHYYLQAQQEYYAQQRYAPLPPPTQQHRPGAMHFTW